MSGFVYCLSLSFAIDPLQVVFSLCPFAGIQLSISRGVSGGSSDEKILPEVSPQEVL